MPFLNCSKSCCCTNWNGSILYFHKPKSHWKHKKQKARHFIHDCMKHNKSLLHDKPRNNIDYPDQRNYPGPDKKPERNVYGGKQLYEAGGNKYDVGNRIKPCTKFTYAFSFSCNSSVYHVSNARRNIQCIKCWRERRKEKESNADYNSARGNDICHVTIFLSDAGGFLYGTQLLHA